MWLENLSSFDKEKKKILSEDQMQTSYFSLTLLGLVCFVLFKKKEPKSLWIQLGLVFSLKIQKRKSTITNILDQICGQSETF